jgi:hypothetical protein
MEGWIKLHRRLAESDLWLSGPFSRGQAWVDLLMLANHKPKIIRKRGILFTVGRGQVGYSEDALADRWGWSRNKVRRFMDELKTAQQIYHEAAHQNKRLSNLITIINYEKHQGDETTKGTTDETRDETTKGTMNKNEKNEKKYLYTPKGVYVSSGEPEDAERCPQKEIVSLYHKILPELTPVKVWTPKRASFLRSRWKEAKERQALEWWKGYFEGVRDMPLLMGQKNDFKADLEWLIRPNNMPKVIEGKYLDADGRRNSLKDWAESKEVKR